MFKALTNLAEMMKRANQLRGELEKVTAEGSSGGGMVRVKASATQEILECKLEPQVLADADVELLEDLIVAATNQALREARKAASDQMSKMTQNLDLSQIAKDVEKLEQEEGDETES